MEKEFSTRDLKQIDIASQQICRLNIGSLMKPDWELGIFLCRDAEGLSWFDVSGEIRAFDDDWIEEYQAPEKRPMTFWEAVELKANNPHCVSRS